MAFVYMDQVKKKGIKKDDRLEVILKDVPDLQFDPKFNTYGYETGSSTLDDKKGTKVIGYVERLYSEPIGNTSSRDERIFMRSTADSNDPWSRSQVMSPTWYVDLGVVYSLRKLE